MSSTFLVLIWAGVVWVRGIGVSDRLKGMRTASANLSWSVLSGDRLRVWEGWGQGKRKRRSG